MKLNILVIDAEVVKKDIVINEYMVYSLNDKILLNGNMKHNERKLLR